MGNNRDWLRDDINLWLLSENDKRLLATKNQIQCVKYFSLKVLMASTRQMSLEHRREGSIKEQFQSSSGWERKCWLKRKEEWKV